MNRNFSAIFQTALNSLLDISNDDLPPMPTKEFTPHDLSEIAEYYSELAKECPFEKGQTVFYNNSDFQCMLRIAQEPEFVKGEWLAVCIHPYAERAVQLPCNFMTRVVYRDQDALLDKVKVMRGGRV